MDIKKQRKQVNQLLLDQGFPDQYPNQVPHPELHAHARR